MVGQDGEIFIDTDKNVPVIQDGITPGGHPLISEEYLLENSLPPKTGDGGIWKGVYNPNTIYVENDIVTYTINTYRRRSTLPGVSGYDPTNFFAWDELGATIDKTYLNVQDGESVWKELSILPEGSVVAVSSDMFLPESDFLKLDGSIKLKQEYPALASIFGDIPVAEQFTGYPQANLYRWNTSIIDNENMVFDGTYYIRILGHFDLNYNIYRTTSGNENPYGDYVQFYPSWTLGATYVDGTQFKIQRSLDGIDWTIITVAPFSNNATRCKSISAGTDGVIYMLVDRITDLNVDLTLIPSYSSILVKSTDHGSTWQEVDLGDSNSKLLDDAAIKKVKYSKPKKVNPTNLIEWQPETQYAINTLLYHKDVIYRVQSIIGSPTTPITAANAPQFRTGQQDDGDYVLVFEDFYDRGCILLPSNDESYYLISIDGGETFTPLVYPPHLVQSYNMLSRRINIIDTPSGTYMYRILIDQIIDPAFNNPQHRFYFITQNSIQTPNLNEVGLYYFNGGNTYNINIPLSYTPARINPGFSSFAYANEPASCYNEETNQIIYAYTNKSDTLLLFSIKSSESSNAAFTAEYTPGLYGDTLISKFYSKIITSPDFDATKPYIAPEQDDYTTWKNIGIVKLHWSPIFGTMVFMKNKIYYSTNPESQQWNVVGNIPNYKNNNFVSCINTPDGVLVSGRDAVFYIKNGDSFALPTIQDDVSLSYPTSYYVKI
jgi:hypothetical protein